MFPFYLITPLPGPVVVKVGGSLFDHPRLGPGLRDYLERVDASCVLVVAGGGLIADAVRNLDVWHSLGEERAHYFAMQATHLTMHLIRELIGADRWTTSREWWFSTPGNRVKLLSPAGFLKEYECSFSRLPHTWELTTDSIAAYAASIAHAKLILLKSIDFPTGTSWSEAAQRGWVDAHFPSVVAKHQLQVEAINFRRWLDDFPG